MSRFEELYPSKGSNLKADDLKGTEAKVVIESNEVAEFDNGKKLVIRFKGKEKGLVLNKTNAMKIFDAFGDNPDDWKGKEIIIYPDKTLYQDSMVDCLRVRIPTKVADLDDDIPF